MQGRGLVHFRAEIGAWHNIPRLYTAAAKPILSNHATAPGVLQQTTSIRRSDVVIIIVNIVILLQMC
jgi:hypothetical protein